MEKSKTIPRQVPIVRLEPNVPKIVAAICFVIAEAQELGENFTQYDIVKTLFLADRSHLNDYGRPVTFDNYCAMYHGPVPSFAYDLLKGNARALQKVGEKPPWTRKKARELAFHYSVARRKCDLAALSSSDKQALLFAVKKIAKLGFAGAREFTHADPAWRSAWRDEGGASKSYPMDLKLFFNKPDAEAAQTVAFLSQHT